MTDQEIDLEFRRIRTSKQRLINETYWWVRLAKTNLEKSLEKKEFDNHEKIKVPSGNSTKELNRTPKDIKRIIKRAVNSELYYSIFVFLVAQVEDFFSNMTYLVLKRDQRRLKTFVQGIDLLKKIDLTDVVDSANRDEIIEKIIKKNIISMLYASPQKQNEFYNRVLGIELPEDLWNMWIEYKATRDIIVHNSGKINEVYLSKAGDLSRGKEGEKIPIDDTYFSEGVSKMKSLIGKFERGARKSIKMK